MEENSQSYVRVIFSFYSDDWIKRIGSETWESDMDLLYHFLRRLPKDKRRVLITHLGDSCRRLSIKTPQSLLLPRTPNAHPKENSHTGKTPSQIAIPFSVRVHFLLIAIVPLAILILSISFITLRYYWESRWRGERDCQIDLDSYLII